MILADQDKIESLVNKLIQDITKAHGNLDTLVLIGISSHGVALARRIAHNINQDKNSLIPVGQLDVSLFRDDLMDHQSYINIIETDIPCSLKDKTVIFVHDIIFKGRAIRAALNALIDYESPSIIEFAALFDRGHRCIPVFANYIGDTINTEIDDTLSLHLIELEGEEHLILERES